MKHTRRGFFSMIAAAFAAAKAAPAVAESLNDGINAAWDGIIKVCYPPAPDPILDELNAVTLAEINRVTAIPDSAFQHPSINSIFRDKVDFTPGPIVPCELPEPVFMRSILEGPRPAVAGEPVFWLKDPRFPFVQHSQECNDA